MRHFRAQWGKTLAIALISLMAGFSSMHVGLALAQQDASSTAEVAAPQQDEFDALVSGLQQQINDKKARVSQLNSQMSAYQQQIDAKRAEEASISNSMALVDNQIAKNELDIQAAQLEIDATNLELGGLHSQIEAETLKIIKQREIIAEYLRQLQKKDAKTSIDLFLTEKTFSDFFNDVQFLQESQRELQGALDTVKTLKSDLETRETAETAKKADLEKSQAQLAEAKASLDEERSAQATLADQAQQTESQYRYELSQLKKQVSDANSDITEIDAKLRSTLDQQRLQTASNDTGGWSWPVDPSRGISTYFHDPDYPFRYIFEHPGIDIRASQGTPVRAAKGGYIARAHDGGMQYSYVMILHDDNLSTVYGHLSRITAKEDTYVEKGDIIGYSGATPGTPGAGPLTTGPHLHFEIRLNGIPVNPLGYLNL